MRKSITCVLTAAVLMLGIGSVSAAGNKPKRTPEEQFAKLDQNSDKQLSQTEFVGKKQGERATKAIARFQKLDKNIDGFLTFEEFQGRKKA